MEVLISLLIMSIGIVSVATMFPLSMLRSIHATQLPNSTNLRYNAEALIDTATDLALNPDAYAVFPDTYVTPPATSPQPPSSPNTSQNYIVDPLGWNLVDPSIQWYFGNDGGTPLTNGLFRYNGNRTSEGAADFLVTLPDSWDQLFQVTATVNDLNSATVPSTISLLDLVGNQQARVLVFDQEGRTSHARMISNVDDSTKIISWNTGLPSNFISPPGTRRVSVETQERRYTWLLTVRQDVVGLADIDIVIFFRRPFAVIDEQVYTANFIYQSNQVTVSYPTSGLVPFFRRGSWVCDADNARWYHIQDMTDPVDNGGTISVTLTLGRPAAKASPSTGGHALFMRGVVDVYPIGTKSK